MAAKLLLALEAHVARAGARGKQHGKAGDVALGGVDVLDVAGEVEARDLGEHELGTKGLGLALHRGRELLARGGEDARVVHDLVGDGDLAAKVLLLDDEHAIAGAREVDGGREARRAAAHDDRVVELGDVNVCHV